MQGARVVVPQEGHNMAKACDVELHSPVFNPWYYRDCFLKSKRMPRIHDIILTVLVLGSCSASMLVLTTIITDPNLLLNLYQRAPKESVVCDFSKFRTSVCHLTGDVRATGSNLTVAVYTSSQSTPDHQIIGKIRPYTRKWEKMMQSIGEVTVMSLQPSSRPSMHCDVKHSVPAVIFSTGGYTGNVYHDFNELLVPLFITSQKFQGEVVYMILEYKNWWERKYSKIIRLLTHYPLIDFESTHQVHCFPEVIVGLEIHGDLVIDSAATPNGESMRNFQELLNEALNPDTEILPRATSVLPKPRLVLISRENSRVLLNQNETIELAVKIGFEVHTLAPTLQTELSAIHQLLHSADVLIGVHGAALTHFLFMRPNSTFIQIVPLGLDLPSHSCFGQAAAEAGMHYIQYKVWASESTLSESLGPNHTAILNPEEINARGWTERKKFYLDGQNIRLSLPRLEPILKNVFRDAAISLQERQQIN